MIVHELIIHDEAPRERKLPADADAALLWKRGQEPIAKRPIGCFALLVPDPFSKALNILSADMPMKGINHVHQQSAARTATP